MTADPGDTARNTQTVILAFDVNETLLDLSALDPHFEETLDSASLRPAWFATMLQVAFVAGLTGSYVDFTAAQRASFAMTAARAGVTVDDAATDRVVAAMSELPAYPDVRPALEGLRRAGIRITALTNSVLEVAHAQLAFAGLDDLFEEVYSADEVRALKPQPEPYAMVADRNGVEISQVWLVAAHGWDVSGALAAGARAAFVARGGAVPIPVGPQPDIVGGDLADVARQLLAFDGAERAGRTDTDA